MILLKFTLDTFVKISTLVIIDIFETVDMLRQSEINNIRLQLKQSLSQF